MGNGSTISVLEARTQLWREVVVAIDGGTSREQAARHFHLCERTIYRILSRRRRDGFTPRVLPEGRVRRALPPGPKPGNGPGRTAPRLVQLVCDFKREYPQKGHHYCHHYLKRFGYSPPSPTTIWRIWRKYRFLGKKKPHQKWRKLHELRKQAPGFFQMDTMYLPGDRFAFVAIDTFSRFAYVQIAERRDGSSACSFLRSLMLAYPTSITGIQTDNGSEFYGSFKKLVQELSLPHFFAWTNCPELNGMAERFVRTVREESLLDAAEPETPTKELIEEAKSFLAYYNNERLHSRIDYLTPMEYLMNHLHNPQVLSPT